MKCRFCASVIDDKSQFCNNCGMKVYQQVPAFEPTRAHGSRRKSGISDLLKGSVIGGLIGVILLIVGILVIVSSFISIFGSVLDNPNEGPGGIVDGILGGFGRIIVGAIICAVGGTLMFWSFIGFVVGAIDSR